MINELFNSTAAILIPAIAAMIYVFGYRKLNWDLLWIGFVGACFSCLSGFDSIYDSINYDNPEMLDYLLDGMWIVGWSLEVLCLFLIIKKCVELQSKRESEESHF